jgi:hypothetical protein
VKLSHSARLIGLQVLEEKVPHQIVLAPHMLGHQVYLELVVELEAVRRPELIALERAVLDRAAQADDQHAALLPHHLPEVARRVNERTLGGDVRRILRVVINLSRQNLSQSASICI